MKGAERRSASLGWQHVSTETWFMHSTQGPVSSQACFIPGPWSLTPQYLNLPSDANTASSLPVTSRYMTAGTLYKDEKSPLFPPTSTANYFLPRPLSWCPVGLDFPRGRSTPGSLQNCFENYTRQTENFTHGPPPDLYKIYHGRVYQLVTYKHFILNI